MSNVDLARVQFGSTTIYHFLFVPITIGLAFLVAILQTMWHRSGHAEHRRLARFFGTLLVINIAIGVVTGLVQEFEFGMNWSAYSRFVGDVFGAPLAMEGLAAFFLESTFLGLWLFGWDRLPKRIQQQMLDLQIHLRLRKAPNAARLQQKNRCRSQAQEKRFRGLSSMDGCLMVIRDRIAICFKCLLI